MVKIFNQSELGKKIREERQHIGDSLESFSQKINIARQTLSRWENGEGVGPSVSDLLRMCEVFNCDFGYLVGEYDCRTRKATDICEQTGLSESAVFSLIEINNMNTKFKDAVFSALDILLDWQLLPELAVRFHQYLSGEYEGKQLYITDDLGKPIGFYPHEVALLLLQNTISDFLAFARLKHPGELSRRITRENINRLSVEDHADMQADFENGVRRGK